MIGYWPQLCKGELFCSVVARYGAWMRYPSHAADVRAVFGSTNAVLDLEFPSRLDAFVRRLPPMLDLSVDRIIDCHTLFPTYAPFLTRHRHCSMRQSMAADSQGKSLRKSAVSNRLIPSRGLRFCPPCAKQDLDRYGETFWHRLHQLNGVEVCQVHRVYLEESIDADGNPIHSPWVPADRDLSEKAIRPIDESDETARCLLHLAEQLSWLVDRGASFRGQTALPKLYIRLLDEQGFAHSRRGDIEMLKTAIQLRYPARLLSLLRADFMHPYGDDWLRALVFRQAQIHSPVHHVLFINFLGYRVDHFLLQLLDLEGDGHEMSENHSLL